MIICLPAIVVVNYTNCPYTPVVTTIVHHRQQLHLPKVCEGVRHTQCPYIVHVKAHVSVKDERDGGEEGRERQQQQEEMHSVVDEAGERQAAAMKHPLA